MQRILTVLLLCGTCLAQNFDLPDAPSSARNPRELAYSQQKCGPWKCWNYSTISNKEVFKSKAFWLTFGGDVALSTLDAEVSHAGLAHHYCSELNNNNSRWQLYRYNLPENAAVGVTAFLWVKFKGPKWVLPLFLARPAYVHIQGADSWLSRCW